MNMHRPLISVLALVGTVSIAASALADPPPTAKVVMNIGKLQNNQGSVQCRLYRSAAGFPEETAEDSIEKRTPIAGESVTLSFESVTAGTYAVSCLHDENNNRKLDKNFFGVPTEGYGVSNNKTYAMSAPKWAESTFTVEAGKDVSLGIKLRY
jgi:uncharacterized protein (DUF2141 family)